MTTRAGFFQAILEDPDDVAVRLIFADWLEETGAEPDRARAELIRRQVRMAELAWNSPAWREENAHVQRLLQAHWREWNGPLHERLHRGGLRHAVSVRRGLIKPWGYRRGFVEALHVEARTLLKHAQLLFQLGPIRHLKLWNARSCMRELVDCAALEGVRTLDLVENDLDNDDARRLASASRLQRLENLYLTNNRISAAGEGYLKAGLRGTRILYVGWAHTLFPQARSPFVRG